MTNEKMSEPLKCLQDSDGSCISVVDVDGFYVVNFKIPNHADVIRSIRNWKCRDDDIILWAYPKTGTHWVWDMTYQLYTKKVETVGVHKSTYMLEALTEEQFDALPSPRILNTHIKFELFPADFIRRRCKLVYIARNPKDTAVSFYNHHKRFPQTYGIYDGKWENYLPRFLQGQVDSNSWFDHVKDCENVLQMYPNYPLCVIHYENLQDDGFLEMQSLAKFIGIDADDELLRQIVVKNKFNQVKEDKIKIGTLHQSWMKIYRKGVVGDWKNWFTVAQDEMFNKEFECQMKDSRIKFRFSISDNDNNKGK